jgi:hypothetical protein
MRENPRFSIAFAVYVKKIRRVTSTRLAKSQQFVNDLFSDENGRVKDLDEKLDAMLSHDDVTHDCINDIVSDLQHMLKIFLPDSTSAILGWP